MVDDLHLGAVGHRSVVRSCLFPAFGKQERSGTVLLCNSPSLFWRHGRDGHVPDLLDDAATGAPFGCHWIWSGFLVLSRCARIVGCFTALLSAGGTTASGSAGGIAGGTAGVQN